jgi:hypothetical protein
MKDLFVRGNLESVPKESRLIPALATERMILRPLEAGDHVQVQRLFPQWDVVRYLNDRVPWPFPENGVEEYQRDFALPAMERGEEWHWTLRLLERPGETGEANYVSGRLPSETWEITRGEWRAWRARLGDSSRAG